MILLYMKLNNVFYIVLLLLLLLCAYVSIEHVFYTYETMENEESSNDVPKIIWTYWDKEPLPDFIEKCIDSWRKHNPNYKVIVLNNSNLNTYLPDLDMNNMKHVEGPAHFSDVIRVHIIAKYGGIWSDASVICLQSYDPILERMKKKNFDFFGYHIDGSRDHINGSSDNMKNDFPVIENWFFAAPQKATIISDWKDKLMECQQYNTKDDYLNELKKTTNLDKIQDTMQTYLWMHCAMQSILQKNKGQYNIEVRKAQDGPFRFLQENEWNTDKAADELITCKRGNKKCNYFDTPFIKFTGGARADMMNKDYSVLFHQ